MDRHVAYGVRALHGRYGRIRTRGAIIPGQRVPRGGGGLFGRPRWGARLRGVPIGHPGGLARAWPGSSHDSRSTLQLQLS